MKIILPIIFLGLTAACTEEKQSPRSYEITIEKDTINLTDHDGKKQGLWIEKNDTVYYKDGVSQ